MPGRSKTGRGFNKNRSRITNACYNKGLMIRDASRWSNAISNRPSNCSNAMINNSSTCNRDSPHHHRNRDSLHHRSSSTNRDRQDGLNNREGGRLELLSLGPRG